MSDTLAPGQPFEVVFSEVGEWVQYYVNLGAKRVEAKQKAPGSEKWILTPH